MWSLQSHRVKATNKNYPAIRQHLFHPSFIPVSSIPHHHPTMARSRPGTCLSPIALNMLLKLLAALCSIALISWNQQDHKSTRSSNKKKTWKIMGKIMENHGKIMEENLYKWRCLFGKIIELLLRGFSACD